MYISQPVKSKYLLCPTQVWTKTQRFIFNKREISETVEERLKEKDSIPETYGIIYRAPFLNYLRLTYTSTFVSIVGFPIAILISGYLNEKIFTLPAMIGNSVVAETYYELAGFGVGFAFVLLTTGITVRQYPLRIYCDKDTERYIAIYQHLIPFKTTNEEFTCGDVKKSYSRFVPWKNSLYEISTINRKAILLDDYFVRPIDFQNMLEPPTEKTK
jgi:hypothetical protein